jgi:hypothetical protein
MCLNPKKPYTALAVGSDRKLINTEKKEDGSNVISVENVLSQIQIM